MMWYAWMIILGVVSLGVFLGWKSNLYIDTIIREGFRRSKIQDTVQKSLQEDLQKGSVKPINLVLSEKYFLENPKELKKLKRSVEKATSSQRKEPAIILEKIEQERSARKAIVQEQEGS